MKVAVAGVGFGAAVHIPALQSEGFEVIGVLSRRADRAQETASRLGIPHAVTDYDELLRLPGLDAVSIATPPGQHHEMSLKAFAAGKHVIVEKPFALNKEQAREMWEAAERSGKTAMVAHEFRFASGRMRVRELIDEGYLGTPRMAFARLVMGGMGPAAQTQSGPPPYNPDRDDAATGGGFLFGLGSHYIDGLRHWFGEVASVTAHLTNFAPERRAADGSIVRIDSDDTLIVVMTFANGVVAEILSTRSAPFGPGASIEVYGSEGGILTPQTGPNPPAHGIILGARVGEEKQQELPIPERLQPFADDRDDRLMPFRLMLREFGRGVETGDSPAPNFYDGYRCQLVLDAARESMATGRRIELSRD